MSTAQPAVGSSSTIWATPSKEWVIPAKPKPGRKPKKDAAPSPSVDAEADSKGRRVQNRAAQRAFRERKQSQLADLQARVQQYEQGEIERNVALQNVAKRLKEENDKLRQENNLLKEKLVKAEEERDTLRDASKKRWRDDGANRHLSSAPESSSRKKARVDIQSQISYSHQTISNSYLSSPSSVSSPGSHTSFSPIPILPPPRDTPVLTQGGGNVLGNIFDFISSGKTNLFESGGSLDTFDCGFCDESTPCVCREFAIQQVSERLSETNVTPKEETPDSNSPVFSITSPLQHNSPPAISILDNLPAYQPPVPLRRRAANAAPNSVFPVTAPPPSCSGDPSNCLACADDPFGRAFCAAITKSVASATPCGNCPCSDSPGGRSPNVKCCGNRDQCGRGSGNGASHDAGSNTPGIVSMGAASSSSSETIPCNDAWRQIKSHPNVAFADLELLADVVARRSKCTGPRVEISPAPGSVTPERGLSPHLHPTQMSTRPGQDDSPVLLTDPHARYHESRRGSAFSREGSASTVDIVVSCGRSRVREVQADGVRDALRLLDKFPTS